MRKCRRSQKNFAFFRGFDVTDLTRNKSVTTFVTSLTHTVTQHIMNTTLFTPAQIQTIVSQAMNIEAEIAKNIDGTNCCINHEINVDAVRTLSLKFESARKDAETVMADYYNVYGWKNIKAAYAAGEIN